MIFIASNNLIKYGGGVEQVLKNLVTRLKKINKEDVSLICNDVNEKNAFECEGFKCVNLQVKQSNLIGKIFLYQRLRYSYKIYRFLLRNIQEGDTVVIEGLEYAFFLSLLRHTFQKKFTLIEHLHGTTFIECQEFFVENLPNKYLLARMFFYFFRWYYYFIDLVSIMNADRLILINKNLIQRIPLKKIPYSVIYNGFTNNGNIIEKTKENGSEFTAIIIGSTTLRKGLDIAINAVILARKSGVNINLTIVGFEDLKKYQDISRLPEFIKYYGRCESLRVSELLSASDFLILPSRHETFPLVVLEAIAHGLPVIVSDACRFEEIPQYTDFGIIVNSLTVKNWSDAINKITKANAWKNMSIAIQKYDFTEFDWNVSAAQFEAELLRL